MKLNVTKWKEKPDTEYSEDRLIRKNTLKPEYGSMMLVANEVVITNGFVNTKKKIGFISGNYDELMTMVEKHNLTEGSNFSISVSPHRIVVLEKLESELSGELGYSEKVNPSTGEILTKESEVIYRKTEVVEEGSDIVDILITHDKTAGIQDDAKGEFKTQKQGVVLKQL
jgi:hypothetical protein